MGLSFGWRYGFRIATAILLLTFRIHAVGQAVSKGLDEINGSNVIPFTYDPLVQPHLVIQVRINGRRPLPFIVDTGSQPGILIDRWAAARLGLRPSQASTLLQPGNIALAGTPIRRIEFVGKDRNNDMPIDGLIQGYVGDLPDTNLANKGPRVAGIIGSPLLSFATIRLDFGARTLTFFKKPNAPLHIAGAVSIPLKERDNGCYAVSISPQAGIETEVEVDTGSPLTAIPKALESRIKPIGVQALAHFGSDGQRIGDELLLPRVTIGEFVEPDVEVATTIATPTLGTDFLSRFVAILDFRNGMMILQRAGDYQAHLQAHGFAGALLREDRGRFYVSVVFANSAAAEAGLQLNDRILSIDHRSLKSLPLIVSRLLVAQKLLDGYAGTKAEIVVERQRGKRQELKFTRQLHFQEKP